MKKKGKISYSKYGYIFCIPFMIAYLIFHFYPTLYTAIIGFTDLRGAGKISFNFYKGAQFFENYKIILTNTTFHIALKNTVRIWLCNFIPQMIMALLLAAWFTNRRLSIPGQGAFKVLFKHYYCCYSSNFVSFAFWLSNGSCK